MERAARSLLKMKLDDTVSQEELARSAWVAAVGKRLAAHATAKSLVRGNLIVEVEDAVWQKQLFHLRYQILPKLWKILGDGLVSDLEFRIAKPTPRRPPQAAQSVRESKPFDEADGIDDSTLRILYKAARKKASA